MSSINRMSHIHNSGLKCPHCDYEIEDIWDYDLEIKQDATNYISCPECDKEYISICHIEVTFSTKNWSGEIYAV